MTPTDATAPRLVGRYALVSRVVAGPLGELFRARVATGTEEGRAVLVRIVPRGSILDARSVELISNAGFAAMELRHAKIAALLDVAVADAEIALVSEHVGGTVLQNLLRQPGPKRVPATPALALRIASDALEAVDAVREPWAEIHPDAETEDEQLLARGVHGGLGPDHLFVAAFGETMLLEAGLAGVATTVPSLAGSAESVAYRAPEQLEHKPWDERADVFTIGVLVWELVAGRSLFGPMIVPKPGAAAAKPKVDPMQAAATKRKVLSAPIQRLDTLPLLKGKVTAEVAGWVEKCLARDPAARFASARGALEALRALPGAAVATTDAVAKWLAQTGVELDLPALSEARDEKQPANRSEALQDASLPVPVPVAPDLDASTLPIGTAKIRVPTPADFDASTLPVGAKAVTVPLPAETTPKAPVARPPTDFAKTAPAVTAVAAEESVPPASLGIGADVESIPPSSAGIGADVESIPPSSEGIGADVESIPPSMDGEKTVARGDIADIAAAIRAAVADSVPPESADAPTIPPAPNASRAASVESVPPSSEDATTLPPPRAPAEPAPVTTLPAPALAVTTALSTLGTVEEATSAPVVRPLDAVSPGTDDGAVSPRVPRRDSRRVVLGVLAAALLLVVIGGIRALLSKPDGAADAPPSASAASRAERSGAEPSSAVPLEAVPAPTARPAPPPDGARIMPSPTPSPAAPGSVNASTGSTPPAPVRAAPKKRFRPTGI
ncbi:MAG TPA: protein kinase [Polyangiaceae bacterium]|nr:protein kinase [Polyangiaceae bacterium]